MNRYDNKAISSLEELAKSNKVIAERMKNKETIHTFYLGAKSKGMYGGVKTLY